MNNITKLPFILCIVPIVFLTGCGSSVGAKKIGEYDKNTGIPYYLPKPYLLITSGLSTTKYKPKITETKTEKPDGTKTSEKVTEQIPMTSDINKDDYSVRIVYLPDLREKYGIKIRPGTGASDTKITLSEGWQLTSLNSIMDTKVAETIEATSGLISAASAAILPFAETFKVEGEPEVSVWLYELIWDKETNKLKFDIDDPVLEWPPSLKK
jgi:hypothetical protein